MDYIFKTVAVSGIDSTLIATFVQISICENSAEYTVNASLILKIRFFWQFFWCFKFHFPCGLSVCLPTSQIHKT